MNTNWKTKRWKFRRNGMEAMCNCKLKCPRCGFLYALDSWHSLWCKLNKKCGQNDRHDQGRNAIVRVAISQGLVARSEPNVYGDGDTNPGARPDILIHTNKGRDAVGDITYRYVNAPSNLLNGNAQVLGRVLQYAEASKSSKHMARANAAGYDFYPMVMSTNGAMAPQLVRLFMEMSEEEATSLSHDPYTARILSSSRQSDDYRENLRLMANAQQHATAPLPRAGPDPPPIGAERDAIMASEASARASIAIDQISPEPSLFWELTRAVAISTQK